MKLQITSVDIRYNDEEEVENVNVLFNAESEKVELRSGVMELTGEEYKGKESVTSLAAMATERLKEALSVE